MASLCASKALSSTKGYVQYRFGTKTAIEMNFPSKGEHPSAIFHCTSGRANAQEYTQVDFNNQGYFYHLGSAFNEDASQEERWLTVTNKKGNVARFDCEEVIPQSEVTLQMLESVVGGAYIENNSPTNKTITTYSPEGRVKNIQTTK